MPKGHKRVKGVPELHNELKTRVNLSLTPTSVDGLDALAAKRGLSRSELVERIGRGQIRVMDVDYESIPNSKDFLQNSYGLKVSSSFGIYSTNAPELTSELTISAIQFTSFSQRHQLPSCPGAYLVTNSANCIHAGHHADLKKRFTDDSFLERLTKSFKNEGYSDLLDLYWIECSDVRALPDVERLLIAVFQMVVNESVIRQRMTRFSELDSSKPGS